MYVLYVFMFGKWDFGEIQTSDDSSESLKSPTQGLSVFCHENIIVRNAQSFLLSRTGIHNLFTSEEG